jgi:hypothetical protein
MRMPHPHVEAGACLSWSEARKGHMNIVFVDFRGMPGGPCRGPEARNGQMDMDRSCVRYSKPITSIYSACGSMPNTCLYNLKQNNISRYCHRLLWFFCFLINQKPVFILCHIAKFLRLRRECYNRNLLETNRNLDQFLSSSDAI